MTTPEQDADRAAFEKWVLANQHELSMGRLMASTAFMAGYQAATTRYEAALREASCALTFASGRCTPEVQITIEKVLTAINKLLGEANG